MEREREKERKKEGRREGAGERKRERRDQEKERGMKREREQKKERGMKRERDRAGERKRERREGETEKMEGIELNGRGLTGGLDEEGHSQQKLGSKQSRVPVRVLGASSAARASNNRTFVWRRRARGAERLLIPAARQV